MPRSNSPLAFEMVVLGQSGGPMETELSGYVLKPYETSWTDGWVGLEGGESWSCSKPGRMILIACFGHQVLEWVL